MFVKTKIVANLKLADQYFQQETHLIKVVISQLLNLQKLTQLWLIRSL